MVQTKELVLSYTVEVNNYNLGLIQKLATTSMIDEEPDDIEIGDEVDIEFVLAGEFTEYALTMAMLFNTSLKSKPYIRIVRGDEENEV